MKYLWYISRGDYQTWKNVSEQEIQCTRERSELGLREELNRVSAIERCLTPADPVSDLDLFSICTLSTESVITVAKYAAVSILAVKCFCKTWLLLQDILPTEPGPNPSIPRNIVLKRAITIMFIIIVKWYKI